MAEYAPDGAVLEAFLQSDARFRGIKGPVGSGKSAVCANDLLDRDLSQAPGPDGVRRTRTIVVRNTYPELRTTTLQTIRQWMDPAWSTVVMGSPIEIRIRARLEDGSRVESDWYLLSIDRDEDIAKLLSLEATNAWLNEARELPRGLLSMMGRRVGRYPAMIDGGPSWYGIVADTNPPDTEHWWYELAEVSTPEGWAFFSQPSGLSAEAENKRWLVAGYYEQALADMGPDEGRVYVLGEYGYIQEGRRVYESYQDWLHCGDVVLEGDRDLALELGLDFGWSAAAVIGQRDAMGRWCVLDEVVSETLNTKAFAEHVVRHLAREWPGFRVSKVRGDPSGGARSPLVSEDQPNTHMMICQAAGLPVEPAPSNDQRLRHAAVESALNRLEGGVPCLRISKRCVQLRKGFNGRYRWPKRMVGGGDEAYGLTPVKNLQSHPHDACQYMLLGGGEAQKVLGIKPQKPPVIPKGKGYGAWTRR